MLDQFGFLFWKTIIFPPKRHHFDIAGKSSHANDTVR